VLEDVRTSVEALSAERATTETALESCGRLEAMIREAHTTMEGLQAERELAERLQRGIRQARSKSGDATDKQKPASPLEA